MLVVFAIYIDVSVVWLEHAYMVKNKYKINTAQVIIMIYFWINSTGKLLIFPSIQKPKVCRQFAIHGFATTLKQNPFTVRILSVGSAPEGAIIPEPDLVTKNMRDALETKFGVTDAGGNIYAMKQFHDYMMVENRRVLD